MGFSTTDTSGMTDADRNDPENFDQSDQQDIAAAAAQAAGVNMGGYDFGGGFDPSDYSSEINSIVNSFMNTPAAASRTGMAIRQSFPSFNSPRSGLNRFANLYTQRMGPLQRATFNSLYDITRTNPGGINTLGYDTAKALGRIGIGTGKVSTNPNAGRLSGTVFSRKNAAGETIISQGGKSAGVDADTFYSGKASDDLLGGDMFDTYYDKYQYASPAERALNRQYDMYMNPYNQTGSMKDPTSGIAQPGFNPDVDPASLRGQVRPGLQSGIFSDMSGTPTRFGPVATYDRNYSGTDNLAMMGFGTMGTLARALTNKVTGIEGQPLPAAALAPTPEMIAQGQTSGGMARSFSQIPGQIKQGIESLIAPNVPAPNPTQIGTAPADLKGFENRFSQHPLTGEKTVSSPVDNTLQPGFSRTTTETLPDGRTITVDKETGAVFGTNILGGPQSSLQNTTAGEQLAGSLFDSLFRDPNISPEAREILKEKGMTIDDLFAPKTPTPEPEKPNIMDLIQGATQTSALGGSATANQLAFDTTGMTRYGNSYVGNNYGVMDKAANSIPGLADTLRSMGIDIATPPTAKIYSSPTSSNAFSRLIGR